MKKISAPPFLMLLKRDLRLAAARGSEGLTTLFFFGTVVMLFPFALGAEADTLRKAAAGIIWVAAALSALLSLESVWHRDFEDGTFDLLLLSPVSALQVTLAKVASHWIMAGLALSGASVIASQMLFIPPEALCTLVPSLLLGTLYMSLLGGFGAVLTCGARRPGLLLALLILPLFIPMLILGVMAAEAALAGMSAHAYLILQAALAIAALALLPPATAKFLEMQVKSS